MKKILLSILVIIAFLGYAFYYNEKNSPNNLNITSQNPKISPLISTPVPSVSNGSQNSSGYRDGEYLGDVADAIYGDIQVKIVIMNGKITDVVFLIYPNDVPHTREVSANALPLLKQETIQAQSANIDNITGATQTTDGYIQSVKSALDKAKS